MMPIEEREDFGSKFLKKIRYRLFKQNKNWLAIMCGDTGSGKSYSALAFADAVVPRGITVKRNVVFNSVEFLNLLTSGKLKKGDIVIFDEAGVGISSRDWYSVQNKLLGSVLQTFRNMNIGVIFTTPNLSFIDVQARKLFHNYFETANIDYKSNTAFLKVYDIQHNSRLDKTYYKSPVVVVNGVEFKSQFIAVGKPRQYLVDEYEKVKSAYTEKLNADALQGLLNPKGDAPVKKVVDLEEVKKSVIENKGRYLKEYKKRKFVDANLLRSDFNVTVSQSKLLKHDIEKIIL